MKLSLIICLYNTKREYFEQCLESITGGTLSAGCGVEAVDYEICVVDDGSTVDYSDLVDKYSLSYYKTENRGIFSARLTGIERARGEYIAFVDSDDTVSMNYHRPMLEEAERSGAEIVFNDWAFHTERTRYLCNNDSSLRGVHAEGDRVLLTFSAQRGREHSYFVLWNKLYSRSLMLRVREELLPVTQGGERFNFSEDALMNFYAFKWAQKLRFVHTGYYFYRIHSTQSVTVTGADKLRRQIECMTYTLDRMEREVGDNVYADEISANLLAWRALMSRTHYSYARAGKHVDIYPVILASYGVRRLRRSTLRDGSAYLSNRLIADNLPDIDRALLSIWRDPSAGIRATVLSPYVKGVLAYFSSHGIAPAIIDGKPNAEAKTNAPTDPKKGILIPAESRRLKNRILLNPFVYRVGMLLFPKGSKLRSLLKKKI